MSRLLLVEDEEHIRNLLELNLEIEGYEVVTTRNGKDALELFRTQHFDIIILDIMLPGMDGLAVCEQIRLRDTDVPIIFLTAKDTAEERVEGLKKGGDDYLVKPFDLEELIIRIGNLIKRSGTGAKSADKSTYSFGDYEVDFKKFEAKTNQGKVNLTKKEARLLKLLIDRKDEVVSRNQILQSVWGYDVYPSTRTIDNFILSFRKYFEPDPRNPRYFISVRGIGYKFVNPDESD